jgi:hypothetical protein
MTPTLIFWLALAVTLPLVAFAAWALRAPETHDAIEYYERWGSYRIPIRLIGKITKEEAEARVARGSTYMIAYFDVEGRRVRDAKITASGVFFEHEYVYDANGKLQRVKTTNADGVVSNTIMRDGKL